MGLFLLGFAAFPAHADILFLNFNHSLNEYRAAKAVAEKVGEKLIAIPSLDEKGLEALKPLEEAHDRAFKPYSDRLTVMKETYGEHLNLNSEVSEAAKQRNPERYAEFLELSKLHEAWMKAYQAREKVAQTVDDFRFDAILAQLEKQGIQVSTLILSAHNGVRNEYYGGGHRNQISHEALLRMAKQHRKLFLETNSIVSLTCYGGTIEMVTEFRKILPQATVIGFDSRAPLECTPLSADLLAESILRREQLKAVETQQEAIQFLRDLDRATDFRRSCSVTATAGSWHASGKTATYLEDYRCDPASVKKTLKTLEEAKRYHAARESGFENPPANPNASVIRHALTDLSNHSHCPELEKELPWKMRLMALLHFREVRVNFNRAYRPMIQLWNRENERKGIRPLPDFGSEKITRKQILEEVRRVVARREEKDRVTLLKGMLPPTPEEESERRLIRGMKTLLRDLDLPQTDWCEEGIWLEPLE